jgi:hypothetical protein
VVLDQGGFVELHGFKAVGCGFEGVVQTLYEGSEDFDVAGVGV